jgi:hypothetical protein
MVGKGSGEKAAAYLIDLGPHDDSRELGIRVTVDFCGTRGIRKKKVLGTNEKRTGLDDEDGHRSRGGLHLDLFLFDEHGGQLTRRRGEGR